MRKPDYVPEGQQCACGCGYAKRPNSKYYSDKCRNRAWDITHLEEKRAATRQWKADRNKQQTTCTCNLFDTCMECRNRERRAAFKENRLPVYMMGTVAAAALNLQAA